MARIGRAGWASIRNWIRDNKDKNDMEQANYIRLFLIGRLSRKGTTDTIRIMKKKNPELYGLLEDALNERLSFYEGEELPEGTVKHFAFRYGNYAAFYSHEKAGIDEEVRQKIKDKYKGIGFAFGGSFYEIDEKPGWVYIKCRDNTNLSFERARMTDLTVIKQE